MVSVLIPWVFCEYHISMWLLIAFCLHVFGFCNYVGINHSDTRGPDQGCAMLLFLLLDISCYTLEWVFSLLIHHTAAPLSYFLSEFLFYMCFFSFLLSWSMLFLIFSILTLHCYLAAFGGGCCFEEVQIIQEQCETGLQDWECSHFCCCTWYVFVVDFGFSLLNLWGTVL